MVAILILMLCPAVTTSQETARPLPDTAGFVQQIRKRLRNDRQLLSQYTYLEKVTAKELDRSGKVKKTTLRVSEVYPLLDPDFTYRRLISKDGKALDAKELEKQDREHAKKLEERRRKLDRESAGARTRRLAKAAEKRRKEEETIDGLFRVFDASIIGRRQMDGLPVIELAFAPRPGYKPKSRETGMMAKMKGRAWFMEDDHEMVRIEVDLMEDISLGLGLLAKLNKGARMVFQRRRVNSEIWLPAEAHFSGNGRLLLFKGLKIDATTEYSDFKKFTVETSVKFSTDKKP